MKRVILLVLAALVFGGFAAFGTYQVQTQADERALSKFVTTEVFVTTVDIPALTSFADAESLGMVKKVKYPTEYLPSGSLRSVNYADLSDVAISDLPPGRLVLAGDFGTQSDRGSALIIPNGYVAVGLDLPPANRAGGFLQPGRRVAVVSTVANTTGSQGSYETRTLMSGLQILAVGTNTVNGLSLTQSADDTQNVVTLAVRPVDVNLLLNAAQSGSVSLVMLSQGTQVPLGNSTSR